MEEKRNDMDAKAKFLAFMVASTGGNITAPKEIVNESLESFKAVKQVDTILEYPEKMFKYISEHPEVREKDPVTSMKDIMDDMM